MTRKDFKAIASAVARCKRLHSYGEDNTLIETVAKEELVRCLCDELRLTNAQFNSDRFREACYDSA